MEKNESVERLEVGKDYANVHNNGVIVIDRIEGFGSNGFDGKIYYNNISCHNPTIWREATESEVIEVFKKHLIHRYGNDWETMKIKERHLDSYLDINDGLWLVAIGKDKNGWNVWNKNGLLYRNGIWVERLEEEGKSDKKRYKVDKASFSDFKQVSLGDSKTNKIIAHFVEQDEETLLLAEKIAGILNLMEK